MWTKQNLSINCKSKSGTVFHQWQCLKINRWITEKWKVWANIIMWYIFYTAFIVKVSEMSSSDSSVLDMSCSLTEQWRSVPQSGTCTQQTTLEQLQKKDAPLVFNVPNTNNLHWKCACMRQDGSSINLQQICEISKKTEEKRDCLSIYFTILTSEIDDKTWSNAKI